MGYSRYVGRVGALAVMLGVGTVLAAPAWADDGHSASGSSASNSSAGSSAKADSKRRAPAGGVGKSNKTPKKPISTATAGTAPVASQSISTPRASAPKAVSALPASGTGTPAVSAALLVLTTAASRRQADDYAPVAAAPAAAATTTVTINTWNDLALAALKYGGYTTGPTAGIYGGDTQGTLEDTSWTLDYKHVDAFGDSASGNGSMAYQATFTYTTPYTQNAFVQSQLKERAQALHVSYSPTNYTAWLVALDVTTVDGVASISTINGKPLVLGDTIVHPAPIWAYTPDANGDFTILTNGAQTDPSWRGSYAVVILPKNVVPVIPGGDITAPIAPTVTASKVTTSAVTLKVSGSTDDVGVVGYNFYRVNSYDNGQGYAYTTIWKVNGSVASAGTTFVDTAVEQDTTYVYTARAVDAAGHESLDSAALVVKVPAPDTEPPTAPTIAATNVTTTTATLVVSGSTDNVGVDGYDIYRDGIQVNVAPIKVGQNFVDTDLIPGSEYDYTAQAFDAAGNYSEQSVAIVVTTTGSTGGGDNGGGDNGGGGEVAPLPIPRIKASDLTDHSVTITVSLGKDDSRVVRYFLYRDGQLIATLDKDDNSYTDDNLDSDVTYNYTAKSLDAGYAGGDLTRSVAITTYSSEEWAYRHGKPDSFWEKQWEKFNQYVGWIPVVGDVLAAISTGIDIGSLLNAIATGDKHQIYEEIKDLGGDIIAFIPFVKAVDVRFAAVLDAIAQRPVAKPVKELSESITFHLASLIYDATRNRLER